ncbi:MAG: PaaI family thioesterase [Burkholderiales bacterium]|nr:PaaI family thioesterase [Burkholderiales bacterium]
MSSPQHPDIPPGFERLPMGGDFINHVGPLYIRNEGGQVHMGLRVEPRHCNPLGNCHGGMLASFADMLLPMTVHRKSTEVGLRFLPTISLQLDYLAAAPRGAWLQGEAQVLRVTRNMVFAQGLVEADGVPCLRVSGILKIGPQILNPPDA